MMIYICKMQENGVQSPAEAGTRGSSIEIQSFQWLFNVFGLSLLLQGGAITSMEFNGSSMGVQLFLMEVQCLRLIPAFARGAILCSQKAFP